MEVFYLHRRQQDIPIEDAMGTLVKMKEEGKIGGIGLSEVAPYTLRRATAVRRQEGSVPVGLAMPPYATPASWASPG